MGSALWIGHIGSGSGSKASMRRAASTTNLVASNQSGEIEIGEGDVEHLALVLVEEGDHSRSARFDLKHGWEDGVLLQRHTGAVESRDTRLSRQGDVRAVADSLPVVE